MPSPICRFSLKGKAIATTSNSDNRNHTEFATRNHPETAKDKASAEKAISLTLADLLPMRWTGTNFEFDEEIDPEQERRLSVKKNQRWENHFPTRSTFKSVRRLVLQTSPHAGFSFLIPADHQRPWTPPARYACVYESWFTNCSLWWPLPEILTTYCHRRKIALGQYTANGIRIFVTLTVLATKLGIKMSVHLFEELTTPSITMKTGFFYGKMVPKYNVITGKPTKVNFWNRAYFYVKINDASFEDPSVILKRYFNANIDRLSKWSQGGSRSFLEEVKAIRTLSHKHWPDISEARIQDALNRISRERDCNQRMGKLNLSSLPSYADTIGTPVRGHDSLGDSRTAKRRRSSAADQVVLSVDPELPLQSEEPSNADNQEPEVHETSLIEPLAEDKVMIADEAPAEEHPTDLQAEEPQGSQPQDPAQAGRGDERVGALESEKNEAIERSELERSRNELLSKELEELKAQNERLETRNCNLEQEKAEVELAFKMTTRRMRESREHEVRKERLRVESVLRQQVALVYEKARANEDKYQEELQGMEIVEASEIVLVPIGLDEHGSNMTAFSPQDIEDLCS
ncbi:hypothetical protein N665_0886s0010 [Sinapis alba]|nr:hypothetical protein N665_0886s0010 [Sinapis alba]